MSATNTTTITAHEDAAQHVTYMSGHAERSAALSSTAPDTSAIQDNGGNNGAQTLLVSTERDTARGGSKMSATAKALLMTPLCLSVLLSALDITIVTPAIPTIVESLQSVTGYIWIGSSFILANTATTPIWGSVGDIWGRKPIMLIAIAIFLAGSLFCALAPDLDVLIAGRVIQGMGSAGMSTMVNVIICDAFSVRDRGLYLGITSLVWAVGSAVGPILGGLLTTRANWRWCFWINLPIGGVVFIILLFFLNISNPRTPILFGLKSLDWTGSILIVGAVLMVLLALDFGDATFPWSSATIICLLVFGVVVLGIFIVNEWKFASEPIIPLHLFTNKSSVGAYAVYACNYYVFIGLAYYLPLYSQAVLGANALDSGLYLLPLIVSSAFSAAFAGFSIQRTGVYLPVMYAGQLLNVLGIGLFNSLQFESGLYKLLIFEILVGVGFGMSVEPPLLAVQAVNPERDTAAIVATMSFMRSIANTISIVVGGVIFQNKMTAENPNLVQQLGPDIARKFNGGEASAMINSINDLSDDQQGIVRQAYFNSLRAVWIMYVAFAGLSLLFNLLVRGHHLNTEYKEAVLGRDRERTAANSSSTGVELQGSQNPACLRS